MNLFQNSVVFARAQKRKKDRKIKISPITAWGWIHKWSLSVLPWADCSHDRQPHTLKQFPMGHCDCKAKYVYPNNSAGLQINKLRTNPLYYEAKSVSLLKLFGCLGQINTNGSAIKFVVFSFGSSCWMPMSTTEHIL